ncbi:MAG TPA: SAM-dependent methyltransferase [Bacteroidales bacterium]|jgi:tRNA U34 5-methylaminomethyl-2-thiouridine-forming methyltransferase MnmC|nr:SAM-dependent methyltransferase [Bacteroidales bacterium]
MINIKTTNDGSNTLYSSRFNEHYHSTFGAIEESNCVYIEAGLNHSRLNSIKVFEVGFGTGLNAILTCAESLKRPLTVEYTAIELYPVELEIINHLNYMDFLTVDQKSVCKKIQTCKWNKKVKISDNFTLQKINSDFIHYEFQEKYDLIYFDAFAPDKQPEMWEPENFIKIYESLNNEGLLTTYSSKGSVKINLRKAGFKVTRLKGPTGKRHILRAEKI